MSEKEKAIQALAQMISQNEALVKSKVELKEWFTKLNQELTKAIESLQQAY